MAAPDAPAAAKNWAACVACASTSNASRCRAARTASPHLPPTPPRSRSSMPFLEAGGHRLEYQWFEALSPVTDSAGDGRAGSAPTLVLLHEGLGSVAMWRDFPDVLARETGLRVLAYSRWGYGR